MKLFLKIYILSSLSLSACSQKIQPEPKIFEDAIEPIYTIELGDSINIENTTYKITKTKRNKDLFVVENNSSKGVINSKHSFIISPSTFKFIEFENYGIKVSKKDSFGLYGFDGKMLLPVRLKGIYPFFDGVIHYVNNDDRQKLYFLESGLHLESDYCDIKGFSMDNNLVLLSQNCTDYGLLKIYSDQSEITYNFQNPKYVSCKNLKGWILSEKSKFGLLNTNKEIVIPFEYDEIHNFKNHYLVRKNEKWGLIDNKNIPTLSVKYESVLPLYYNDIFTVKLDGKTGVLDLGEKEIIPITYDRLNWQFHKKVFIATKNHKKGIITEVNKIVLPFEYDEIEDNWLNGYIVSSEGKFGVMSNEGVEIIPTHHHQINLLRANSKYPDPGFHVLDKNIKTAFFNILGEQMTDFVFDEYEIHGTQQPIFVKIGETEFFVNAWGECVDDCPTDDFLNKYGLKKK